MKEGFVNVDTLIEQVKLLGDMELQAYLATLSETDRQAFIVSNVTDTVKSVDTSKSSKFGELLDKVTGADNNITSSAYYVNRTKDIAELTKDLDDMTVKQLNVADINSSAARRQYEINEWSNFNKLDTLYIFQITLISLSLIGVFLYLSLKGIISDMQFKFTSGAIILLALVIILLRWRYTNVARDGRYWHKAQFARQYGPKGSICPKA